MINRFKRILLISLFLSLSLFAQIWQVEDLGVFEVLHINESGDRVFALPSQQEVGLAIIDFENGEPNLTLDKGGMNFVEMTPDSAHILFNPAGMHQNFEGEVLVLLNHGPYSKIYKRDQNGNWMKVFEDMVWVNKLIGEDKFVLMEYETMFGSKRKISYDFGESWIDVEWDEVWANSDKIIWHPLNESTLFIANYSGVFVSSDSGRTIDQKILDAEVHDIALVGDGRGNFRLFASTGWYIHSDSLLVSDDFGLTWSKVENHPGFLKMDSTIEPDHLIGVNADSFGISTDGGNSWDFYPVHHPTLGNSEILLNVVSSKTHSQRYFVGSFIGGFYYSNDKGVTWHNVRIPRGHIADIETVHSEYMYAASELSGGLFRKIGKEWETIYWDYDAPPTLIRINPTNHDNLICAFYDKRDFIPTLSLMRSTDRGDSWVEIFTQSTIAGAADLKINPQNTNTIFLATGLPAFDNDTTLWRSQDAGLSWEPIYYSDNFTARSILIDPNNSDHLLVAGDPTLIRENSQQRLIRSIDGGETWQVVWETEDINHVYNLLYADTDQEGVLFLTSDKGLLKSTDFGDTWEVSLSDSLREITQDPVTGNLLAFSLKKHQLYISGNLGETWIEENSFTEQTGVNYVTKLHATTDARGQSKLFAGTFGAGLFSSPSILVSVEDEFNEDIPNNFHLAQNYPNPFNPSTTIEFSIPQSGLYEIAVYNILGQKVKTLLRNELQPGSHKVEFNAAELASGIYLYKLTGNNITLTKKMILIK